MVPLLVEKLETQLSRRVSNPDPHESSEEWKHSLEVRRWDYRKVQDDTAGMVSECALCRGSFATPSNVQQREFRLCPLPV